MSEPLDTFLRLRARLNNVREADGWILGSLIYSSQDAALETDLSELHEYGVVREMRQKGELVFPGQLEAGSLEVQIDTGNLPTYFETYNSLIAKYPVDAPENFMVWQRDSSLEGGYRFARSLLQFLRGKAEVWDSTQGRFFLVDQLATEIPLRYEASQTLQIPTLVPQVVRFLDDEHIDADARWAFFRKAVTRLLRDIPVEFRLNCLLQNLSNVLDRSGQDYALYLERFSFEDLLKTFDETRLKFVADLNNVLAAIQTALIAVPIAFFLVAEKLKPSDRLLGQNAIIGVGGLIFFGLLFLLSINQGRTLFGIRAALIDFEAEQTPRRTNQSERLKALLKSTWSHYRRVRLLLWVVRVLLILFALVIAAALFWCSTLSWQKIWPYA